MWGLQLGSKMRGQSQRTEPSSCDQNGIGGHPRWYLMQNHNRYSFETVLCSPFPIPLLPSLNFWLERRPTQMLTVKPLDAQNLEGLFNTLSNQMQKTEIHCDVLVKTHPSLLKTSLSLQSHCLFPFHKNLFLSQKGQSFHRRQTFYLLQSWP